MKTVMLQKEQNIHLCKMTVLLLTGFLYNYIRNLSMNHCVQNPLNSIVKDLLGQCLMIKNKIQRHLIFCLELDVSLVTVH
jgi:hypothetical protein